MNHLVNGKEERIAKFESWRELCKKYPSDYKIEYHGERGNFADACLMRRADDQFYVIERLERWYFKNGDA